MEENKQNWSYYLKVFGGLGILLAVLSFTLNMADVHLAPKEADASGTVLSSTPSWTVESNQVGAWLGYKATMAGDVNGDGFTDELVMVPSYANPATPNNRYGAVYLYLGSASGMSTSPSWHWYADATSQLTAGTLSGSIASAGDVNRDGKSDIMINSYNQLAVWYGGKTGMCDGVISGLGQCGTTTNADWIVHGESNIKSRTHTYVGSTISSAGDVNGDHYDDIMLTSIRDTDNLLGNVSTETYYLNVYLGSASGLKANPVITDPDWIFSPNRGDHGYITSIRHADINGDGKSDVIMAHEYTDSRNNINLAGSIFAWYGGRTGSCHHITSGLGPCGSLSNASWRLIGTNYVPLAIATVGDFNHDNMGDIVSVTNSAMLNVYLGANSGPLTTPAWQASDNFRTAFGSADVNGDGYSDLISGIASGSNGGVRVWLGNKAGTCNGNSASTLGPCGTGTNYDWSYISSTSTPSFGRDDTNNAGDVNNDNCDDLIVGDSYASNPEGQEGQAVIFHSTCGQQ